MRCFFLLKIVRVAIRVIVDGLRSPTANWLWRGEAGSFLPDNYFFKKDFPGKKPQAATQRGFALPDGMRSISEAHGSAKLLGLCQKQRTVKKDITMDLNQTN